MSSRREFLKKLGIGSVAVAGAAVLGTELTSKEKKPFIIVNDRKVEYNPETLKQYDLESKLDEKIDLLIEKIQFGGGINKEEYNTLVSLHSQWMDIVKDKGYPSIAFNYFWVGKAHYQFGETKKMMVLFNEYLTCNVSSSTHSKYCIEIGDLMFKLGKNEDAVRFYEYAKFKIPNAPVKRKIAKCLAA